jgi:hypothetical protein
VLTAQAIATIALGLLVVAGVAKVVDPDPTSGALRAARLPVRRPLVRFMGVAEVVVAGAALLAVPAAVGFAALAYLGFTGFTAWALRTERPIQSCGCFGSDDTPPGLVHVVVNAVSAGALALLWLRGLGPIPALPAGEIVGFLGFGGLGVFGAYLLLAVLPQTLGAARP